MPKKKLIYLLFILALVAILVSIISFNNVSLNDSNDSGTNPPASSEVTEKPQGSLLVIPETSLGIIGLFGACSAGLAVFALKKNRQK